MRLLLVQRAHFENNCPSGTAPSLGPRIWAIRWIIIYSTGFKRIKEMGSFILNRFKDQSAQRKEKRDCTQCGSLLLPIPSIEYIPIFGGKQSMQTKAFILHEEVYLPRDVPSTALRKASHASTPTPSQKGHQDRWHRTPQNLGTETAPLCFKCVTCLERKKEEYLALWPYVALPQTY